MVRLASHVAKPPNLTHLRMYQVYTTRDAAEKPLSKVVQVNQIPRCLLCEPNPPYSALLGKCFKSYAHGYQAKHIKSRQKKIENKNIVTNILTDILVSNFSNFFRQVSDIAEK